MKKLLFLACSLLLTMIMALSCQDTVEETENLEIPELDSMLTTPTLPCNMDQLELAEADIYLSPNTGHLACLRAVAVNEVSSRRLLEIFETENCQLIDSLILPENSEPDFPYYLADINYNKSTHLVGIRGDRNIYCYDLKATSLLNPIDPVFLNKRNVLDAQSGMIRHLELWEHYLIGYAQDQGTFIFDLASEGEPKPLMPIAEYKLDDGVYHQLFAIPTVPEGTIQLLLPEVPENSGYEVNPLLDMPKILESQITEGASNNRYIILRDANNIGMAIDMQAKKVVDIDPAVSKDNNEKILDYLRKG